MSTAKSRQCGQRKFSYRSMVTGAAALPSVWPCCAMLSNDSGADGLAAAVVAPGVMLPPQLPADAVTAPPQALLPGVDVCALDPPPHPLAHSATATRTHSAKAGRAIAPPFARQDASIHAPR